MKTYNYKSVLSIAGFDGSGGAGIQADMKTISALGCYATTVLTALPIQNTRGVQAIYPIPVQAVKDQLQAVLEDIPPQVIKIGMIHTGELLQAVVEQLQHVPDIPIVFDPVMVSTSGHQLIDRDIIEQIIEQLFPLVSVITPNMDEASVLAGMPVRSMSDMLAAGPRIAEQGCPNVLLKGGHLPGSQLRSILFTADGQQHNFDCEKIITRNIHGSGCTLSSAIACFMAGGDSIPQAVAAAQEYVYASILAAKDISIGHGNGPLNHFHNPQKMKIYEMV